MSLIPNFDLSVIYQSITYVKRQIKAAKFKDPILSLYFFISSEYRVISR